MRPCISIWGCVHWSVRQSVRPSVGNPFCLNAKNELSFFVKIIGTVQHPTSGGGEGLIASIEFCCHFSIATAALFLEIRLEKATNWNLSSPKLVYRGSLTFWIDSIGRCCCSTFSEYYNSSTFNSNCQTIRVYQDWHWWMNYYGIIQFSAFSGLISRKSSATAAEILRLQQHPFESIQNIKVPPYFIISDNEQTLLWLFNLLTFLPLHLKKYSSCSSSALTAATAPFWINSDFCTTHMYYIWW